MSVIETLRLMRQVCRQSINEFLSNMQAIWDNWHYLNLPRNVLKMLRNLSYIEMSHANAVFYGPVF